MKNKTLITTAITTVIIFLLTTLFYISPLGKYIYFSISAFLGDTDYRNFERVADLIDGEYMGDYDEKNLMNYAISSYVAGVGDPYTNYFDPESYKMLKESLSSSYKGIGIEVMNDMNRIRIMGVTEGSPAKKAGIEEGDIILKVEGKAYDGDKMDEAISKIKSTEEGKKVNLTIKRGELEFDVAIIIEEIKHRYVESEMLEDKIGYVKISTFGDNVYEDFYDELKKLDEEKMTSLIIDLRGNPGGVLDEVTKIADTLLPEGKITTVKDKDGNEEVYESNEDMVDVPIAVLIDEESASASEVLSGALRDYNRATLIGEKSFGKGVVQSIYEFNDGSALRVTIAKYYTPKGECIHKKGIKPDIEIKQDGIPEFQSDMQLQKAIEVVKEETKSKAQK